MRSITVAVAGGTYSIHIGGGLLGRLAGPIWFMGWLFTIGFSKLSFFRGLLALIIWPYYIGDFLSKFAG